MTKVVQHASHSGVTRSPCHEARWAGLKQFGAPSCLNGMMLRKNFCKKMMLRKNFWLDMMLRKNFMMLRKNLYMLRKNFTSSYGAS